MPGKHSRLHAVDEAAPLPRPSFVDQLKENWLALVLAGALVSVVTTYYFTDVGRIYADIGRVAAGNRENAQAIEATQKGVNQIIANQAADTEWKRSVMDQFRAVNQQFMSMGQDIRDLRNGQ